MAQRRSSVQVVGRDELRRLADELRRQGNRAQRIRELDRELRKIARPLERAARAGALSIPSRNESARRGRRSLRADLAKSVSTSITTQGRGVGAHVFMNPRKMPDGKKALPKYVEGVPGWTRWRHPVFGDVDVWVAQGSSPFFTRAIESGESKFNRAMEELQERIKRDLESSS